MRHAKFFLLLAFTLGFLACACAGNSLTWQAATDHVSADVRGEALWPLLEDIAHQTGWHIFLEPGVDRKADVKFQNLPRGEALKKLLGDLNFAFVPQTNGPDFLYVFTTMMQNATRRVVAPPRHVSNQLLIKVKPGTDIEALAKSVGAKIVGRDDKLGIYLLEFPDAAAADAALALLKNNPDVEEVGYNYLYDPPPASRQVSNPSSGPFSLTLDPTTQNDPCNPVIGVLDTKMQSLGSQLDQFVLNPISVVGDTADTAGSITHGTAMAETILNAISQASGGHTGARILPVQVFDGDENATTWNVALGVKAAVDNGATVLNMSLGSTENSPFLDAVIQMALARGVVIFAAAGNEPVNTPTYPAAYSGVNAVTALGAPGQLASYANYGSFVGMALPGTSFVQLGGDSYVVQGTSPASAYATGVAVGTKSMNCDGWSQIEAAMQQRFPVPAK